MPRTDETPLSRWHWACVFFSETYDAAKEKGNPEQSKTSMGKKRESLEENESSSTEEERDAAVNVPIVECHCGVHRVSSF